MNISEVTDWITRGATWIGLPSAFLWYLKSAKKDRAEGRIAERTERATVTKADASALEAHVLAVENAFAVERASKDRQIADLKEELKRVEGNCDQRVELLEKATAEWQKAVKEKDEVIEKLEAKVAALTEVVEQLKSTK